MLCISLALLICILAATHETGSTILSLFTEKDTEARGTISAHPVLGRSAWRPAGPARHLSGQVAVGPEGLLAG